MAIATAFAGGILLGRSPFVAPPLATHSVLFFAAGFAAAVVLLGFLLPWRGWLKCATAVSLGAWVALGFLAVILVQQPLPAEHIPSRMAAHEIPPRALLRWHGVLRSEPSRLPRGHGLEMNLSGMK